MVETIEFVQRKPLDLRFTILELRLSLKKNLMTFTLKNLRICG
jgi:hypothetical protein